MQRVQIRRYRDVGITTLRATLRGDPDTELDRQLADLGRALDLVRAVNEEGPHKSTGS